MTKITLLVNGETMVVLPALFGDTLADRTGREELTRDGVTKLLAAVDLPAILARYCCAASTRPVVELQARVL